MNVDIERLLLALDIDAKRNGREWVSRCPLPGHEDAKPSWSIRDQEGNERHGRHHCFSCKQGGSIVSLVRDRLGFTRRAEVELWLFENGISSDPDLPVEVDTAPTVERDLDDDVSMAMPKGVIIGQPLGSWVTSARVYAARRGITPAQVEKWGIGYAIDGRCIGRIWLPIRDIDGRLLSYTARSYTGSDLRYLTPSRDDGLRTDALFGCAHWSAAARRVVVTEGALNALACERAGANQIAALGGSSLTPTAMAELSIFDEVDIFVDNDAAGDSVALQLYYSLARWRACRRLSIAPGANGKRRDANDLPVAELQAILAA